MRLGAKEEELRLSVTTISRAAFGIGAKRTRRRPAGLAAAAATRGPRRGGAPGGTAARGGPPRGGEGPGREPGQGANRPGGPGASGAYESLAYDAAGRPSAADAPALPAERDGAASTTYWAGTGFGVALVVPLGGEGPCAYLLARIPPRPAELRDQLQALLLVVVSVLGAAWFAAGPVIGKLRRLGDAVRQSAASHYATPVPAAGGDEVAALARAFNEAGLQVRTHLVESPGAGADAARVRRQHHPRRRHPPHGPAGASGRPRCGAGLPGAP